MICELKEKDGKPDWCERHQAYHIGRMKHWALSDTEKGEQYRQIWDRQLKGDEAKAKPFRVGPIKAIGQIKSGGCNCGKKNHP